MQSKDVQKIFEAGLISDEQRQRIIEHFHLEHPQNRFLAVLVALGGALLLTGVVLVISANWDSIPGLFKIFAGAALMAAAHFGGWQLQSVRKSHPRVGEALHFLGAGLFLANIALVGQVYHLSSRAPDAFLLWLIGIVPLAWILRSRPIHILSIIALFVWLATEVNAEGGWFHFASNPNQFAFFAAIGLLLYGFGLSLKRTSYAVFSGATEGIGLLALHLALWPLVLIDTDDPSRSTLLLMAFPAVLGLGLVASSLRRLPDLSAQWRNVWFAILAAWMGMAALGTVVNLGHDAGSFDNLGTGQALAAIVLVTGCILQMRVAEELREPGLVNIAIVTFAYTVIVTFFRLVGSMMNTGMLFVVGGAGLLGFGFWLERKRRAVIQRINA